MDDEDLLALERRGWDALSSGPAEATRFYDEVLDGQVLMLLPGGLVLTDRQVVLESMGGQPWARYELLDPTVLRPTEDTKVVAYGVLAARDGQQEYAALVSSMYVRRGAGWRLTFHQQTPR